MEFDHQGVLVENGEPEKAAEETHKKLLDIWAKYKDSCRAVPVTGGPTGAAAPEEPALRYPVLRQKRVRLTSRLFVPVRQANTPGEWWR